MTDASGRPGGTFARVAGGTRVEQWRREIIMGSLHLTARLNDAVLAGHEFSTNREVAVLSSLRIDGPQRLRALTARTGMTRAGTTNLVDRFEQANLVRRGPVDDDQRGVVVELTHEGVAAVDAMADRITETFADAAPWIAPWGQYLHDMGIEAGALRLPAGSVRRRLDDIRRMTTLGAIVAPLYAEAFGPDAVRPFQLLHLLLLATEPGGTRPTLVGDATLLSSASTSDLLSRAERGGLITRSAGRPPDRRVTVVTATERGRKAVDLIVDGCDEMMGAIADVFFPG